MGDQTTGKLMDHEYDGIQEYDNPCPAWWHMIFIGTVLFSAVYFVFFQLGKIGWTVVGAHQQAVASDLKMRFEEIGELASDEATLLKYMQEPDWLTVGETVYATNCKACHGDNGSGLVGPNLTDDYYKPENVKNLVDIARVIEVGAAAGSMPAWRSRLHPNEIVLVAAYVANMRGQNLTGPRPAEGEVIAPWPEAAAEPEAEVAPEAEDESP
jgi:cytochrome c oxidase cbb3-type subunit 3